MTRKTRLPEPWLSLAIALNGGKADGCVQALAKALGCTTRSLHGWAQGKQEPSPIAKQGIKRLFVENSIDPPTWP